MLNEWHMTSSSENVIYIQKIKHLEETINIK
jgi:hypothetical protein